MLGFYKETCNFATSILAVRPNKHFCRLWLVKTYRERLIAARTHAGFSQSLLAEKIGVKPQAIQYLEDKSKNAKGSKHTSAIARECGVNADWLGTERGGMLDGVPKQRLSAMAPHQPAVVIDRLSAAGSMGNGHALEDSDNVVERVTLVADWVKQTLPRLSSVNNLKVISAYGDSMTPTFTDGDLLLIDTGIKSVDIDGVFVLRTNGRLYIKRVRQRLDGTFEVKSDNPLVGVPEELTGKTKVDVLGRVVWAWNGRKL